MKIGVHLPRCDWPGSPGNLDPTLANIGRAADAGGFAGIWVMDHFFQIAAFGLGPATDPMLEAYTALALGKLYRVGRGLIPHHADVALQHGLAVVHLEQSWGIFVEWRIQALVLGSARWTWGPESVDRQTLLALINHLYLDGHFAGTLLCLTWLALFRPRAFPLVRSIFVLSTVLALVVYLLFPMMPPRLMGTHLRLPRGYHIVDTLAPLLADQHQQAQLGFNPYAAMPSVHFAWALIVGLTLVASGRQPAVRLAGVVYPGLMLVVIVVSGNHLLLDAAGAGLLVAVSTIAALVIQRGVTPLGRDEVRRRSSLTASRHYPAVHR